MRKSVNGIIKEVLLHFKIKFNVNFVFCYQLFNSNATFNIEGKKNLYKCIADWIFRGLAINFASKMHLRKRQSF